MLSSATRRRAWRADLSSWNISITVLLLLLHTDNRGCNERQQRCGRRPDDDDNLNDVAAGAQRERGYTIDPRQDLDRRNPAARRNNDRLFDRCNIRIAAGDGDDGY